MGNYSTLRKKLIPLTDNKAKAYMDKVISRLLKTEENFAIWGAGNTGQWAIEYLRGNELTPKYIVDNNPSLWGNGKVISPEEFFGLEKKTEVLLICVYVADQVAQQVREAGYKGEVVIFSSLLLLDTRKTWDFYERNMSEIEETYAMLNDAQSHKTLEGFLNSIRSGDMTYLEKINGDSRIKLLDPVLLGFTNDEVFVDIGAFTGDTIMKFLELTNYNYKKIVGFELDKQNYETLRKITDGMERVDTKNMAVGAKSGTVRFLSGRSESSILSEQGDCEAEMVALDDLPELHDVTFIKISANSFELSVLQGAEKLLQKKTPKLAMYVSGDLLWKIPLYLKRIAPEYELYFRHYGYGRQAMTCYAVRGSRKRLMYSCF